MLGLMCVSSLTALSAGLKFDNSSLKVLEETPDKNTGLDKIYVCYDMTNVDIIYETSTPSSVKIYRFSNLGGAYSEDVKNVEYESSRLRINNAAGNCGYIVEDGDKRYYYWIVDYLPYRFIINSLQPGSPDCDASILDFSGVATPIHYFTINGQQRVLGREIKVTYDTQEWNSKTMEFEMKESSKIFDSLGEAIRIMPPAYASTSFHLSGDKFLKAWNWLEEQETVVVNPSAITAYTSVAQNGDAWQEAAAASKEEDKDKKDASTSAGDAGNNASEDGGSDGGNDGLKPDKWVSNQIHSSDAGLGGSAPVDIEFRAYASEGVLHHEWQMSRDPQFNDIENRFNQQDLDYTFYDEGTFYLRYIASNADGSCEAIGETYTVGIGASELLCPNAFSPNDDGVNDEWKVSYRSITEFKCWIFDRYGAQMCYFDNPELGWDGKKGGKYVKPGVYYYVIQATGADGKKYKLDGDINIVRHNVLEKPSGTPAQ